MTEPQTVEIKKDAIVGHIARPGRWQIVKINKVTVQIKGLDEQRPNLVSAQRYALTEAPEQTPAGESVTVPLPTYFDPGQIVTSFIPKIAGVLMVVERDNGGDKVTAVPLFGGGDGWHVPRPTLSLVEPHDLLSTLLLRVYPEMTGGDEQGAVSMLRGLLDADPKRFDRALMPKANGS